MGNSLLDFVMALVRDPDTAARFAADPVGALAEANLAGVSVADVNNLIPVVTDSLSMTTPGFGATPEAGNVWTTGAAAVAFDAFDLPRSEPDRFPTPELDGGPAEAPPGHQGFENPAATVSDLGFDAPLEVQAERIDHLDPEVWAADDPWQPPHHDQQPESHPGDLGFEQI